MKLRRSIERHPLARGGRLFLDRTAWKRADLATIALLALAGLGTSVHCAQAVALAERAHAVPARCPYHFGSAMPSATFCVYRGVAFGSDGEVCATDVVVLWSSVGAQSNERAAAIGSEANRDIYLGFVADPDLVLRAIVHSRHGDRAEVVGYTMEGTAAPRPLAGETTLRTVRVSSSEIADVLSMELFSPRQFHPRGCAFASYSGTFMGVIGP